MANVDLSVFGRQQTLLDHQRLQEEFEARKQQQKLHKFDILLKQQELRQKGMGEMLTTDPAGGMGGYAMDMNQFDFGGVTPDLVESVMRAESGGNPNAVSPAGAQGLMQIMPDTAKNPGYGVQPLQGWDGQNPMTAPPEEQVRFGKDYLNAMLKQNGGNKDLALAAYNAGPGAVQKYGGIPPFQETQNYVQKVNQGVGESAPTAKPLYQGGKPFTTGLNAGYQWATDAQGNRVAIKIPGTPATKDEMDQKKQATSKEKFDATLLEIQDLYDQLADEGQIRTQEQGVMGNIADYYRNNPYLGGKQLGDLYNTPSSSIRERIDAAKSRAAALYIDAAGLSSGQTNSIVEQERFLKALGGYDKGYEANQQILEGLSNTYGSGKVKQRTLKNSNAPIDYTEYFK